MDSHQQQQESPQAKTGAEDMWTGLLLRQAILQTNSPYQQGNCTPLGMNAYKVIVSKISWYTGMLVINMWFSHLDS